MYKDKFNKDIVEGCVITDSFNAPYLIKNINGKLYADNGGHCFPLDSMEYDLSKFRKIELEV